jgi:hypothetical protein
VHRVGDVHASVVGFGIWQRDPGRSPQFRDAPHSHRTRQSWQPSR